MRYQEAGIGELVRFDPATEPGRRLRVWDRIQGDLVEAEATRCAPLGLYWVVRETPEHGEMLRLARDAEGAELLPTLEEARAEAERRQAELEAELRRLRRGE